MRIRKIETKAVSLSDFGRVLTAVSLLAALYATSLAVFMNYIGQSM